MLKSGETKSSAYTTTFYKSSNIHDQKSAVIWFRHVLTLDCFEDMYMVCGGKLWKNDLEITGDKFTPEEATESHLNDYVAKSVPRFLCVTVNYDGDHCVIGVDLFKNMAYVTMKNKEADDLPWLIKILPE